MVAHKVQEDTVAFSELGKYNDSNSFVIVALDYDASIVLDVEKTFKAAGFIPKDAKILGMKRITGNVRGHRGRTDILFHTTETTFNAQARRNLPDVKWTSDFMVNCARNYSFTPVEEFKESDFFGDDE